MGATIDKNLARPGIGAGLSTRPHFTPGDVHPLPMTVEFSAGTTAPYPTETNLRSWLDENPIAPRNSFVHVLNAALTSDLMIWNFGGLHPTSGIDPFPVGSGNGRVSLHLQPASVSLG